MRLIAEFKRADGKPVPSYRDYPLALAGDITTPSGKRTLVKFPLERARNGVYVGEPALEAPMETGEYRIALKVLGGDRYRAECSVRVRVEPVPYLLVDEPREGASIAPSPVVSVRARLLKAGKPVRPQDEFTNHPDYLVIAQVIDSPDGEKGNAIWLRCSGEGGVAGRFTGIVPVSTLGEGKCKLAVKIAPEEHSKEYLADQTIVDFQFMRPRLMVWLFFLIYTLIFLLVATVVLSLVGWMRTPRLGSRVCARSDTGEGAECVITGKKLIKVGSGTGCQLRIPDAEGLIAYIIGRRIPTAEQDEMDEEATCSRKGSVVPVLLYSKDGGPIGRSRRVLAMFFLPWWSVGLERSYLRIGETVNVRVRVASGGEATYEIWLEEE